MSGSRHLYFAYGSNLDPTQMSERCPHASMIGLAKLPAHRLAFTRFSRKRQCGVADIIAHERHEVWGVIFSITGSDLQRLDLSEGYNRQTDSGAYIWRPKQVQLQHTPEELTAFTYVVERRECPEPLPSRAYLGQIVNGGRHWKLPVAYTEMLLRTQTLD